MNMSWFSVSFYYRQKAIFDTFNALQVADGLSKHIQFEKRKPLPLHESQQILLDTQQELQIRLKHYVTYDLIIELLHFADRMKVIQPQELIDKIREEHEAAAKQYI